MTYQRKTKDYWDIEQLCYGSWEVVNAEETWADAKRSLREYRENQPEYPVRARKKRERITDSQVNVWENCQLHSASDQCPACGFGMYGSDNV